MLQAPEAPEANVNESDDQPEPRYAAQRSLAARRGHLPSRLLINRARFEGAAHRRLEESSEEVPFLAHPTMDTL